MRCLFAFILSLALNVQAGEPHVSEIILVRPHGTVVAGFGNSYRTDGDFLRYIYVQRLSGGTMPTVVMTNGEADIQRMEDDRWLAVE